MPGLDRRAVCSRRMGRPALGGSIIKECPIDDTQFHDMCLLILVIPVEAANDIQHILR